MHITLSEFPVDQAAEIALWAGSEREAKAWAGQSTTFPVYQDQLRRWHDDPDVHAFVGTRDSAPMAYGELWVDREEQEIELARIIVHPAHRGMGVGRSFVEKLVNHAAGFESGNLFLRVLPDNLAAIRCYQAAGFVTVSPEAQQAFNCRQPHAYLWLKHASCA